MKKIFFILITLCFHVLFVKSHDNGIKQLKLKLKELHATTVKQRAELSQDTTFDWKEFDTQLKKIEDLSNTNLSILSAEGPYVSDRKKIDLILEKLKDLSEKNAENTNERNKAMESIVANSLVTIRILKSKMRLIAIGLLAKKEVKEKSENKDSERRKSI